MTELDPVLGGEFLLSGKQISLNVVLLLFCAAFSASEGNVGFVHVGAAFGLKYLSLQQEITPCRTITPVL